MLMAIIEISKGGKWKDTGVGGRGFCLIYSMKVSEIIDIRTF